MTVSSALTPNSFRSLLTSSCALDTIGVLPPRCSRDSRVLLAGTRGDAMPELIPFAGDPLDRVANERHDEAWVEERRREEGTRFLPLWRLQAPFREDPHTCLVWTDAASLGDLVETAQTALLGLLDGIAQFAVDVSELEEPVA